MAETQTYSYEPEVQTETMPDNLTPEEQENLAVGEKLQADQEQLLAGKYKSAQELEKSLGGLFSLLTVEFLVPYLNRTLLILQRSNQIPRLPKDVVRPKIVAGINSLGRGQDNESLTRFIQTVAATLGPEALVKYIDPSEAIKRLAAAQGIDVLNLVRTAEQLEQLKDQTVQDQTNKSLVDQAGQLAGTPLLDPSKNPDLADQAAAVLGNIQPPQE